MQVVKYEKLRPLLPYPTTTGPHKKLGLTLVILPLVLFAVGCVLAVYGVQNFNSYDAGRAYCEFAAFACWFVGFAGFAPSLLYGIALLSPAHRRHQKLDKNSRPVTVQVDVMENFNRFYGHTKEFKGRLKWSNKSRVVKLDRVDNGKYTSVFHADYRDLKRVDFVYDMITFVLKDGRKYSVAAHEIASEMMHRATDSAMDFAASLALGALELNAATVSEFYETLKFENVKVTKTDTTRTIAIGLLAGFGIMMIFWAVVAVLASR